MSLKEAKDLNKFVCPQHYCGDCHRSSSDAGGLIFRCATCTNAYCEDCISDIFEDVGDVEPNLLAHGYGKNKFTYYIKCEECIKENRKLLPSNFVGFGFGEASQTEMDIPEEEEDNDYETNSIELSDSDMDNNEDDISPARKTKKRALSKTIKDKKRNIKKNGVEQKVLKSIRASKRNINKNSIKKISLKVKKINELKNEENIRRSPRIAMQKDKENLIKKSEKTVRKLRSSQKRIINTTTKTKKNYQNQNMKPNIRITYKK